MPVDHDNRRKPRKSRAANSRQDRFAEVRALREWLDTLPIHVNPTVHVNGPQFSTAYVTVDFGQPLDPIRLPSDIAHELMDRLRKAGREISGAANLRVSTDGPSGIYWVASY